MKRISFVLVLVLIAMVTFTAIPVEAFAEEWVAENGIFDILGTSGASLHSRTKLNQDSNDTPTITVFTHGMDSKAYFWGGTAGLAGENSLWVSQFEEKSFPMQLLELYNSTYSANVAELYVAFSTVQFEACVGVEYENTGYPTHRVEENTSGLYFELRRVDSQGIVREAKNVSTIDFNKNIIIVYQDSINQKEEINGSDVNVGIELALRYDEFHYIIDSICDAALTDTGSVPRLNLIGHSRGGLINMMYAIHHKYNVDLLYSLGTPYNGSSAASLRVALPSTVCQIESYDINNKHEIIQEKWNESNAWQYVNLKTISSTMDLKFVIALFQDWLSGPVQTIDIEFCRNVCQALLDIFSGVIVEYVMYSIPLIYIMPVVLLETCRVAYLLNWECISLIRDSLNALKNNPSEDISVYIDMIIDVVTSLLKIENDMLNYVMENGNTLKNDIGDVLVSLQSQQAEGYNNIDANANSNYEFSAQKNIFGAYKCEEEIDGEIVNIISLKSDTTMPAVPHNLESRHPLIVDEVLSSLTLANCSHVKTYSNNGNTHTRTCACGSVVEEHDYTYSQISQISPLNMQNGISPMAFILPLPSNNLYVHRATCTKCAYTTQLEHDWTEFGTGYKCGDCLLFATNIPIARPDNYFTLQQQIAIGTLLEGQTVAISDTEQVTLVGGVYYLSHVNVGLEPVLPPAEDC